MEKIRREISLEQFKNRFYKGGYNSGITISDDIIIDSGETQILEIANNLPILKVGVQQKAEDGIVRFRGNEDRYYDNIPEGLVEYDVLRFRTMMDIATHTEEFFRESKIYQFCKRGNGRKIVESSFATLSGGSVNFYFSETTPALRSACTNLYEDESGNTYFAEDEECSEGSLAAYAVDYSNDTLYNVDNGSYSGVVNYIAIGECFWVHPDFKWFLNVYSIPEDSGDTGLALSRAIYFVNFTNRKKHIATDFEGFIPITFFMEEESEDMGVFTSIASEWQPNKQYILGDQVLDSDGVVWTLISGLSITLLSVPSVLISFIEEQLSSGETYIEYTDSLYSTVLTDLEHTYIKNNGNNDYSFVKAYYSSNTFEDDGHWRKESDSSLTEYTAYTESKLSSYKKADIDDNLQPLPFKLLYNTENEQTLELLSGGTYEGEVFYVTAVPFVGVDTARTSTSITFTYYAVGNDFSGNSELLYTEVYPCEEVYDYFDVTITETDLQPRKLFKYLDIDFTRGEIESIYDLYGNVKYAKLDATIYRDGTESQDVPYFKEEALFGIHDVQMDVGDLTIERGKSAAYERHSVLGEVATMEDLVKYKNGFFRVIDDENNQ